MRMGNISGVSFRGIKDNGIKLRKAESSDPIGYRWKTKIPQGNTSNIRWAGGGGGGPNNRIMAQISHTNSIVEEELEIGIRGPEGAWGWSG